MFRMRPPFDAQISTPIPQRAPIETQPLSSFSLRKVEKRLYVSQFDSIPFPSGLPFIFTTRHLHGHTLGRRHILAHIPPLDAQLFAPSPQRVPADSKLFRCFVLTKVGKCSYVAFADQATFAFLELIWTSLRDKQRSAQALAKSEGSGPCPSVAQSTPRSAKRTFAATMR